ncbi:MAG TPA: hypothetical protein VGO00_02385 [Kofleriaceae bacterium]|nr:hypothetical protein [Kofleriaceae bacterium]
MKVRIATCAQLPEADTDEAPLMTALAAAGIDASLVAWDDPRADWETPIPTVLRSTWNYAQQADAFLAWIDRAAGTMINPRDVVHDNIHKRYLVTLASRGVPVVPTTIVERGGAYAAIDAPRIVVKPEVGCASFETHVFAPDDPAAAVHVARLAKAGAVLVQPYVDSVDSYGERSIVWIDGELTHAIRKTPRFSGDDERIEGPFPIADDERDVALAALAPYVDRILYGRVDLARDASGRPMVMELELIEPSLFLARHPPALDRFIRGLVRRA